MNHVVLSGRLTRDPELSYTQSGLARVRLTIAVDRQLSREKKQEYEQKQQATADFINVTAWGRLAETCANFTAKGKRIMVLGRIQTGSYQGQDGTRRYTFDVVATQVEFIDWKDRDDSQSYSGNGYGASNNYPSNSYDSQMPPSGFSDEDFTPIDDERIPF